VRASIWLQGRRLPAVDDECEQARHENRGELHRENPSTVTVEQPIQRCRRIGEYRPHNESQHRDRKRRAGERDERKERIARTWLVRHGVSFVVKIPTERFDYKARTPLSRVLSTQYLRTKCDDHGRVASRFVPPLATASVHASGKISHSTYAAGAA